MSESESYRQKINSIIEAMPPECYWLDDKTNESHITDDWFEYLEDQISLVHLQAGHCICYKKGAYKFETKIWVSKIVLNGQAQKLELRDCDLTMEDLDDPKIREAQLLNFMLSYVPDPENDEQNPKNIHPMRQGVYFE